MRAQVPGSPETPEAGSMPDTGWSAAAWKQADEPADLHPLRPFVERRRHRPAESTWHEALDSVHRLLVRYEETNRFLSDSEEIFRGLFENALIGIFRLGSDGEPLIVNRSMAAICGYDSPEQFLAEIDLIGERLFVDPGQWNQIIALLELNDSQTGIQAEIQLPSGASKWLELSLRTIREIDGTVQYEGTAIDVTERKAAEDRIRLLAYYDRVTGLPNRALFDERLAEALAAARWKSERVALMVFELGRFKVINDSLGKDFGDRLLQEIAERIKNAVGQSTTVARVGGAEFAIILENVGAANEVSPIAERTIAAITAECSFLGNSLSVSCTMGISLFPLHAWDGQMLLERAHVAMYSAKEQGTSAHRFFTEEMNHQIRERLRLENGLRLALDRNELYLVYQPQVDIRTGDVSGLEALLRWRHPERGIVPPAEFISIAEGSGLIVPIGEWVLRTACAQACKWQQGGLRAVPIAVNVSAIQLRQQGFCEMVRRVLLDTGLEPQYLELELTEGLLLTNVDLMHVLIQELRDLGVKITIDDFGTGYSSLGYLREFKVNRLKIDRSFVREVSVNPDDAAIATAIINMARALNLEVLAEGVENVAQLDFLRAQKCYEIQGYYFSKPVPVEQVEEQLKDTFFRRTLSEQTGTTL